MIKANLLKHCLLWDYGTRLLAEKATNSVLYVGSVHYELKCFVFSDSCSLQCMYDTCTPHNRSAIIYPNCTGINFIVVALLHQQYGVVLSEPNGRLL